MRKHLVTIYLLLTLAPFATVSSDDEMNTEEASIKAITESITSICDKPGDAGSYLDIKVKSDSTDVKLLKLIDIGVTGKVDFSAGEWDGVERTIEDAKDYRACAEKLTPLFIEKFRPVIEQERQKQQKSSDRILGGIKYQQSGAGVAMTLESCEKKISSVTCRFTVRAEDADVEFGIYGYSAIYDQDGHKFRSNYAKIANFNGDLEGSSVEGELVKGIDTKVSIRFGNVRPEATTISKVEIIAWGGNTKKTFDFRNIKIKF